MLDSDLMKKKIASAIAETAASVICCIFFKLSPASQRNLPTVSGLSIAVKVDIILARFIYRISDLLFSSSSLHRGIFFHSF